MAYRGRSTKSELLLRSAGEGEVNRKLEKSVWMWSLRERTRENGIKEEAQCRLYAESLDYFAMAQSTPSDLYFRKHATKADRHGRGINSIGQVLQFPRKRDNASRDASLQRSVIVVPSKWTVYRWKVLTRDSLALCSWTVCAYAGMRSSLSLSLSNSISSRSRCLHSAGDGPLRAIYHINRVEYKLKSHTRFIIFISINFFLSEKGCVPQIRNFNFVFCV